MLNNINIKKLYDTGGGNAKVYPRSLVSYNWVVHAYF